MSTLSIRISEDPARPMGHAILTLSGLPNTLETFEYAISRHGFAAAHLGTDNWQGAESWLQPEEVWYSGEVLKVLLPPHRVFQLENMPYTLSARGQGLTGTLTATFIWPLELAMEEGANSAMQRRIGGTPVSTVPQPSPTPDIPEMSENDNETPTRAAAGRQHTIIAPVAVVTTLEGDLPTISAPPRQRVSVLETSAESRSNRSWLPIVVLCVVVIVAIAGGGWWWSHRRALTIVEAPRAALPVSAPVPAAAPSAPIPAVVPAPPPPPPEVSRALTPPPVPQAPPAVERPHAKLNVEKDLDAQFDPTLKNLEQGLRRQKTP